MLIDCETCAARGDACGDCVVSVLMPPSAPAAEWDEAESRALALLAAGGLIAWPAPHERPARPPAPVPRGRSPLAVPLPLPLAAPPIRRAG